MEMEPTPPMIAKKLWNTMRILFFMMRKGISKSKLMIDLQMLLKQGETAGKELGKYIMLHRHQYSAAMSCRSSDASLSFVSPREYEFSCSNTPLYPSYHNFRRKNNHHNLHHNYNHHRKSYYFQRRDEDVNVIQKVFDILNKDIVPEASPLFLPGFGKSPAVRQLRITDSPFPLKDTDEDQDTQVDKAAEEFIKKFYKELKHQKKMASPSPFHIWAS